MSKSAEAYDQLETLRHGWQQRHGPIEGQRRSTQLVERLEIRFANGRRARLEISGSDRLWTVVENPDDRPTYDPDSLPAHVRTAMGLPALPEPRS